MRELMVELIELESKLKSLRMYVRNDYSIDLCLARLSELIAGLERIKKLLLDKTDGMR